MDRYDVIVVGAGPAGSTAARYAALGGASTLLIERRRQPGSPVQCGEFLPTTSELHLMFPRAPGLDDLFAGAAAFVRARTRTLRVFSPARRGYDVRFDGLVLDRDAFERSLANSAVSAGAEIRAGTRVLSVEGDVLETDRGTVQAGVIVGADGPKSVVARDAGFGPSPHVAFGVQYLLEGACFDPKVVEMYFGPIAKGGYAWVIPKGDGLANVGVGVRAKIERSSLRRDVLDPFVHALAAKRPGRTEVVRFTAGLIPVGGPRKVTVRGNVLLAGDAAGHLMPCNGGGIPTAMICGRIAGEVAAQHGRAGVPLSEYERRWRRAVGQELAEAVTTRRIFDVVTHSDVATELAMTLAGASGMRKLMTCRAWYWAGLPPLV